MMSKKSKIIFPIVWVILGVIWAFAFFAFRANYVEIFPKTPYEVYAPSDEALGGGSSAQLAVVDTAIYASINIRSGVAYPYAGIGFNLMSVNKRPAGFFDFSKYDSIVVVTSVDRMRYVQLRIWNDDPVYSKKGNPFSYRPLNYSFSATFDEVEAKAALRDFKVPDWWLAAQGLDKDDGLTFFHRGVFLEVVNGEGILRGIPDSIMLKSIRLWGVNRDFEKGMFFALGLWVVALIAFVVVLVRKKPESAELVKRMEKAAKLLKTTDRSIAEIAITIGEKSPSSFERHFCKIYKQKPLEYRRKNA